jgi:hypothetical protein
MQELVYTQFPKVIIVSLIFFSDQTFLYNDVIVICYPFMMSIENIACENKYLNKNYSIYYFSYINFI